MRKKHPTSYPTRSYSWRDKTGESRELHTYTFVDSKDSIQTVKSIHTGSIINSVTCVCAQCLLPIPTALWIHNVQIRNVTNTYIKHIYIRERNHCDNTVSFSGLKYWLNTLSQIDRQNVWISIFSVTFAFTKTELILKAFTFVCWIVSSNYK